MMNKVPFHKQLFLAAAVLGRSHHLSVLAAVAIAGAAVILSALPAHADSPEGLIAWWPGDGGGDELIGGHHGTLMNGATTAPGIIGDAFSFDGIDDFVQVPDASFLPQSNAPRTVTLWFKSDKNLVDSPESAMFFYGDEGNNAGMAFGLITSVNARGKLYWFGWGVPPHVDLPGVTTLQPDTWYFAAVTYDRNQNLINLWLGIDGALRHEGARFPLVMSTGASPSGVRIGAREDWPRWDGLIDEVKLYDRALSPDELFSEYLGAFNSAPVAVCDPTAITVEAEGEFGALITQLDGSASSDPDGDELLFHWDVSNQNVVLDDPDSATPNGIFPIGVTTATLTVIDGNGGFDTCDVLITVEDTTPPEVMCTSDLAVLWPPNHTMHTVRLIVTGTDAVTSPQDIVVLSLTIRSDEPDDSYGDGVTIGDVNGEDGHTSPVDVAAELAFDASVGPNGSWVVDIQLRAEREGGGDGRCYTIDVVAMDTSNNIAQSSCCIIVPHDRRNN